MFTSAQAQIALETLVQPPARSVQTSDLATFIATYFNPGENQPLTDCQTSLASFSIPATLSSFDLDGSPLAPFSLAPLESRDLILAIDPDAAFTSLPVFFDFNCTNQSGVEGSAPVFPGVNSVILSASDTPTPDIIALAVTSTSDGTVDATPIGAFAVVTTNLGSGATITASANTGSKNLPVSLAICETDPATGVCINPPAPAVSTTSTIDNGESPTYSVFVSSSGFIGSSIDNRIFVVFEDEASIVRGSTSVAVTSLVTPPPSGITPGTWTDGTGEVCFNVSLDGSRLTPIGSACDNALSLDIELRNRFDESGQRCDIDIDYDGEVDIVDGYFGLLQVLVGTGRRNFVNGTFTLPDLAQGGAIEVATGTGQSCIGRWGNAVPSN